METIYEGGWFDDVQGPTGSDITMITILLA
jgi:hypothetical protein